MVCVPTPVRVPLTAPSDAFGFADGDAYARTMRNAAAMWSAPWRAWWAVMGEAMDPGAYARAFNRRG